MSKTRLVMLNYAGDYREAYQRLTSGGKETYYAQKYSVDTLAGMTNHYDEVIVIVCMTEDRYDEVLPNGVRAIGLGQHSGRFARTAIEALRAVQPSHLIISFLMPSIILWALLQKFRISVMFSNSYLTPHRLRSRIKAWLVAKVLNNPKVHWVGVYGANAARSFERIGVNPTKIIPWDYLHETDPKIFQPVTLSDNSPKRLIFIGRMIRDKGLPDLLRAVKTLKDTPYSVEVTLVGLDENGEIENIARQEGVLEQTHFAGIIPTDELEDFIREFDAVTVPSRRDCPEGYPLVIFHALKARVPVIASDHPIFVQSLKHREEVVMFEAQNPLSLAQAIQDLFSDADLYENISNAAEAVVRALPLNVHSREFIENCFDQVGEGHTLMATNALVPKLR